MTAEQIPVDDFRRIEVPVHLVVIDQTAEQAEERWGWKLERGEYETDQEKFAMCSLKLENGDQYFLMCHPEGSGGMEKMSVSIHADFGNPTNMEQNLKLALGLEDREIMWRNDAFDSYNFRLFTRDEDGNRVVVSNHAVMDEAVMARTLHMAAHEGQTFWVDKIRDNN